VACSSSEDILNIAQITQLDSDTDIGKKQGVCKENRIWRGLFIVGGYFTQREQTRKQKVHRRWAQLGNFCADHIVWK